MSGPEFATLMGEHAATGSDERKIGDEWVWGFDCECGEFVPDRECNQHLADAINEAIARWLGDEGTREVVARAMYEPTSTGTSGRLICDYGVTRHDLATAALAALTTTDQEDR